MRPTRTLRTALPPTPSGAAATDGVGGPSARRTTGVLRRLRARFLAAGADDRGDVPGWVLVTLMTAGLVVTLWAVAGPRLAEVFESSLSSVQGPGS